MDIKKYSVTCLKCKQTSRINIANNQQVIYVDHTPIIACRLRGDMQWGFECMCGNDNRLAALEKKDAGMLVQNASESAMTKILDSIKIDDKKQFRLELA